jgi:hypothetical protein
MACRGTALLFFTLKLYRSYAADEITTLGSEDKKAPLILHTDNDITIHSATEYDEKSGIVIYE